MQKKLTITIDDKIDMGAVEQAIKVQLELS